MKQQHIFLIRCFTTPQKEEFELEYEKCRSIPHDPSLRSKIRACACCCGGDDDDDDGRSSGGIPPRLRRRTSQVEVSVSLFDDVTNDDDNEVGNSGASMLLLFQCLKFSNSSHIVMSTLSNYFNKFIKLKTFTLSESYRARLETGARPCS